MRVEKLFRIIFLVPLILIFVNAFYCMIFGASFINNVYYGFEGFLYTIIAEIITLWWLILICIIGIVITVIVEKKPKKRDERK